jgi:hypothetical protein
VVIMDVSEVGHWLRTETSRGPQRPVAEPCEYGNKPSGFIKAGNFLTK